MAKYLVTNGSYFQPCTYDELSKPNTQAVEAHNAAADAYETLASETQALQQYLMREPEDSYARKLYDNYMTKLSDLQNNLWERGYNAGTRRDLAAARAGYASDITRLGTAIKARQDLSNEYWKTKHDHPDMVMGSDPGLAELDRYLENDRYGRDYYSYSGAQFANEVALDAKARANEMLNDPEILDKYPQLKGYIPILKKEGFTSQQVEAATLAVRAAYAGNTKLLDSLDPASAILASVLTSNLNSTGAFGKVTPQEFSRLIDYGRKGLASSIGESKPEFMHDLVWAEQQKIARENERFEHNKEIARIRAAGKGQGQGQDSENLRPKIASLRGNILNGMMTEDERSEYNAKKKVLDVLSYINELKKKDAAIDPETGRLADSASKALQQLHPKNDRKANEIYSQIVEKATGSKQTSNFIRLTKLDSIIEELSNDVDGMVTNDSIYSFDVTSPAAEYMAQNVFKLNIGELKGKQGRHVAESVAHYSNDKPVNVNDLLSILASPNLNIGFDAKSGRIVVQRMKEDRSDDNGKYDDRLIFLDPNVVLSNTSAYANLAALTDVYEAGTKGVSATKTDEFRNKLAALANDGRTVDLRRLAKLLHDAYKPMVKDGDDDDRIIYNSLVESFGEGLFMSSNVPWSPNPYKMGWGAKTGGEYQQSDYDNDDYLFE